MIMIEEITNVDGQEFDALFAASLPAMDAGTLPWGGFPTSPSNEEEKRETLRSRMAHLLTLPDTKAAIWRKDGIPIEICIGTLKDNDPYITWLLAVYGPDASGTKAWLYDPAYLQQSKDWLMSNWGLEGYRILCVHGASLEDYHLNRKPKDGLYEVSLAKVEDDPKLPGVQWSTIQYRYL